MFKIDHVHHSLVALIEGMLLHHPNRYRMDLLFRRTGVNVVPNSVLLHAVLNRASSHSRYVYRWTASFALL